MEGLDPRADSWRARRAVVKLLIERGAPVNGFREALEVADVHVLLLPRMLRRHYLSRIHLPGPRAHVAMVSAVARFRRPALAVATELERPVAFLTTWRTAVRHHPRASQPLARPVHLCRKVIRPRVRS